MSNESSIFLHLSTTHYDNLSSVFVMYKWNNNNSCTEVLRQMSMCAMYGITIMALCFILSHRGSVHDYDVLGLLCTLTFCSVTDDEIIMQVCG